MLSNYFTLRALVNEWSTWFPGSQIEESYSQSRSELTLAFQSESGRHFSLRVGTQAPLRYMFCYDGHNRARRNTLTIFSEAIGEYVASVRIADGDRQIGLVLQSGQVIRIDLYGPRANVYLMDTGGLVQDRFRQVGTAPGEKPPDPRPWAFPDTPEDLKQLLERESGPVVKRLQRSIPVFDRHLANEVLHRFGRIDGVVIDYESLDCEALYQSVTEIRGHLMNPEPRIYNEGEMQNVVSMIAMHSLENSLEKISSEPFESANAAVRTCVRQAFSRSAFDRQFRPVHRALLDRQSKSRRRLERMCLELSTASRADQYELYGHLLMASQNDVPSGAEEVRLPDLIGGSGEVTIPLESGEGVIQNAERYYLKARHTRTARATSEDRVKKMSTDLKQLDEMMEELKNVKTTDDIEGFRKKHSSVLSRIESERANGDHANPFRQFSLPGGFQVWVGRNAAQNDMLTTRAARKFDYWLHARGVAGSHVVLRLPGREVRPPRRILEQAAAIAAYFSKARTSALVPVIYTQKKFVRKPRKSLPGSVVVDREEVIMVEPVLPVIKEE